jgi:peptidoglycan/LPS O-acetylase OafA/YrhL
VRRDPGFDGVRAVAALAILVFHAASTSGLTQRRVVGPYLARLDVAVAIFFVLSGYLLYRPFAAAHCSGTRARPLGDYAARRVLRIYPAYWVALLAAILLFHSTELHGTADYTRHFLLVQIYTPAYGLAGIIPTWTLAVEVSFYAALPLYALAVGAIVRRRPRHAIAVELAGAAVVYLSALAVRAALDHANGTNGVSTRWLPAMADWFALGLALAVVVTAVQLGTPARLVAAANGAAARGGMLWLGALLAFVATAHLGLPNNGASGTTAQDLAREVLFGLSAVLLIAPIALASRTRLLGALTWRPMAAIGLVSYGVFLWHFDWLEQLGDFGVPSHGVGGFIVLLALAVPLTLLTATASYWIVERPALRLATRRKARATVAA